MNKHRVNKICVTSAVTMMHGMFVLCIAHPIPPNHFPHCE